MDRRTLLKLGANVLGMSLLPLGGAAWGARLEQAGPRLVVVFLRGAVDGLNVVVPYADDLYYEYRPTIAVAKPGSANGLIDLDGHFGLHPALAALQPLWKTGQLAFIHACGSPDPDRSHFEAQAYMETAMPGIPSTTSGWMNRLATAMQLHQAADVVAFGATTPLIVRGPAPVATFPTGRAATHPEAMDRGRVQEAFDRIYLNDSRLGGTYREALQTRSTLLRALDADMSASAQGAPDSSGFPADAVRAARMMTADPKLRLVFFQLGGWDTHVSEGAGTGQLANHLKPLGDGLAAFTAALGPQWRNTVVMVVSEFGRTARENGNRGTDHGHGNAHWVLGGAIGGGHIYGDWRGLSESELHQNRDLPVTTDFRSVIALIAQRHLNVDSAALRAVLADYAPGTASLDRLFA